MDNLLLGETSLASYIAPRKELSSERRAEIVKVLSGLDKIMNVEQLPVHLLQLEFMQYPEISPEFLSMSQTINYKGHEIKVPRFSVYHKNKGGFNSFSYTLADDGEFFFHPHVWFHTPPVFEGHLLNSLDNFKDKATKKKFKKIRSFQIETTFQGIIPKETKERIEQAEAIFGNGIYMIAETKPEQWREARILTKDPIIVGISSMTERCYLIDHFQTTPVEDYVRREFSV